MEFEIIDESEVVYSRRGGVKKKTWKEFEKTLGNRTYWGRDCIHPEKIDDGTVMAMRVARAKIRRYAKLGIEFDVDDDEITNRLCQEFKDELIEYQKIILEGDSDDGE